MALHFYDSADSRSVPSGVHAAVYINGRFAWPASEQQRMSKIFSISVEKSQHWASRARCIDVESGAASPDDVVPFVKQRRDLGFDDATVYVDRSNHGAVVARLNEAHLHGVLFWVATLDGTQNVPGAWAVQYQGGIHAAFDLSVLHGVDNFHTP